MPPSPPPVTPPNVVRMFLRMLLFILAITVTPMLVGGGVWALAWWHGAALKFWPTLVTAWAVLVGYIAHVLVLRWAVRPHINVQGER